MSADESADDATVADSCTLEFDDWRAVLRAAVSGTHADRVAAVDGSTEDGAGDAAGEPAPFADAATDDTAPSSDGTDDFNTWDAALLAAITVTDASEARAVDERPTAYDDGDEWDAVLAAVAEADAVEAAVAAVAAAAAADQTDADAEVGWTAAVGFTAAAPAATIPRAIGEGNGDGLVGDGCDGGGGGGGGQGRDPVPASLGDCPICLEALRPPPPPRPSPTLLQRASARAAAAAAVVAAVNDAAVEDERAPRAGRLTALWCGHVLHEPCAEAAAAHSECCPVCRHAGSGEARSWHDDESVP